MGNTLRRLSIKVPNRNSMSSSSSKSGGCHIKCRHPNLYMTKEGSGTSTRGEVPEDKVSWSVQWKDYKPTHFTCAAFKAPEDQRPAFADPEIGAPGFNPKWNSVDGHVDRTSFTGRYMVVDNVPRNPMGRTGITGRGVLGKWGPNHAADPIVTRWKRSSNGNAPVRDSKSGKPILQFVSIQRRDTGEWAIPGGMVDAGEERSETLKREFGEEALNSLQSTSEQKKHLKQSMDKFFASGTTVYQGYVDDPRNTDSAWMETVAKNFHDASGEVVGKFSLTAGDDAASVRWLDVSGELGLYASHRDFLARVADMHKAHW